MRIKTVIYTLYLLIFISNAYLFGQKVDTTLIKIVDITFDSEIDTAFLRLQAPDWNSPIHWYFEIRSHGKKFYEISNYDTTINDYFKNENNQIDCSSYLDCKKKWYLIDMLKKSFPKLNMTDNCDSVLKEGQSKLAVMTRSYLKRKDFDITKSKVAAKKLCDKIQKAKEPMFFAFMLHPVVPLQYFAVYDIEINSFIEISEW